MLIKEFKILIYLSLLYICKVKSDEKTEYTCNINCRRPINFVSDKFLSISIDPAVLLAGVNLSETSLRLAKHLRPAYIRLAGPSTQFVRYVDEENFPIVDSTSVTVTPSIWFAVYEWLSLTQLMPVFGINDAETARDVWNPKPLMPLFEISDKLNVTCFWQLGFDSSNKTEMKYKQDLSLLQHVLSAFPEKVDSWKIIGSDLSSISGGRSENIVQDLEGIVNAVMWEPERTEENFLQDDSVTKFWPKSTTNVGVWTTIPKSQKPVTFLSALVYARQVGDVAKAGYEVVFRQPRMLELVSYTPVYWFSLVYKKLMGSTVLDTRTTVQRPGSFVYAHCTRNQNSYVRRGALTILIVNENAENYKVKVKLGSPPPEKAMEVQEYILTSENINSTEVFLNDVRLTKDHFHEREPFKPAIRRAKTTSYISLSLPGNSVGFFVLPGSRLPVCIDNEIETNLLLEEIEEAQNAQLPEELEFMLTSRSSFGRNHALEEITEYLKKELAEDVKYYKSVVVKSRYDDVKVGKDIETKSLDKGRKFLIERAKQKKVRDFEKERDELKKFLVERTKIKQSANKSVAKSNPDTDLVLEITTANTGENNKALKHKNIGTLPRTSALTDEELDKLISEAKEKFVASRRKRDINRQLLKLMVDSDDVETQNVDLRTVEESKAHVRKPRDVTSKRAQLKNRMEDTKQEILERRNEVFRSLQSRKSSFRNKLKTRKGNKNGHRYKRDINLDLLKAKVDSSKRKIKKSEPPRKAVAKWGQKEATLRQSDQTSDEILEEMEFLPAEREDGRDGKTEVFAELADSDYPQSFEELDRRSKSKKNGLFDKKSKPDPVESPWSDREHTSRKSRKGKNKFAHDQLQFLTSSEEFTDIEDDLPCIHEYYGKGVGTVDKQWDRTIQELGEFSFHEKNPKRKNKQSLEFHDDQIDLDDDLFRRKRSSNHTGDGLSEFSQEISNLGELLYPTSFRAPEKIDLQGISSVGQLLYPREFAGNQIDDDDKNGDDYYVDPLVSTEENNESSNSTSGLNVPEFDWEHSTKNILEIPLDNSINTNITTENVKEISKKIIDEGLKEQTTLKAEEVEEKQSDEHEEITTVNNETKEKDHTVNLKSRMFGTSDETTVDDKASNHLEEDYDDLRHKRDRIVLPDRLQLPDFKEEFKTYQEELKEHFKDLQELIAKDKKRFDEEKKKNRMKLLHLQKKQYSLTNPDDDADVNPIQESKNEIIEQFNLLRRKIQSRKNEIDALIMKNFLDKHDHVSSSKGGIPAQNTLERFGKISSKSQSARTKRSPDNPKPFGIYHPHSLDVKPWTAADILSLKREKFLHSELESPPDDYGIFKNIVDQYKLSGLKKRSIKNDIDYFLNDIDSDIDDKGKKAKEYAKYKYKAFDQFGKIKKQHSNNEILKETEDSRDKKLQNLDGLINNEKISKPTSNIQKIGTKNESGIFAKLIKNITVFLSNLGQEIGSYVKNIAYN